MRNSEVGRMGMETASREAHVLKTLTVIALIYVPASFVAVCIWKGLRHTLEELTDAATVFAMLRRTFSRWIIPKSKRTTGVLGYRLREACRYIASSSRSFLL